MQWWVTHKAEQTRIDERKADEEREIRRAYWALWAEYFRIWAVAQYWREQDLLELAALDQLRPEDFLPRDWAAMTAMFGRLGSEAAQFGAVALTVAFDVSRRVAQLVEFYRRLPDEAPSLKGPALLSYARTTYKKQLDSEHEVIRGAADEAANILQDALHLSPLAHVPRPARYRKPMTSKYGKKILEEFEKRQAELAAASSTSKTSRWSRIWHRRA